MIRLRFRMLLEILLVLVSGVAASILVLVLRSPIESWIYDHKARNIKPLVMIGDSVSIKGTQLSRSPITLVLITSPSCRFCQSSIDFHRRLSRTASNARVGFYIVTPKGEQARDYVIHKGLVGQERLWDDLSFRVAGTPTIVLVNSASVVRGVWLGKLDKAQEVDLYDLVGDPSKLASLIPDADGNLTSRYATVSSSPSVVSIIDVQERPLFNGAHIRGALNLPAPELPVRALFELDPSKNYGIDCTVLSQGFCQTYVTELTEMGFAVRPVGKELFNENCDYTKVTR